MAPPGCIRKGQAPRSIAHMLAMPVFPAPSGSPVPPRRSSLCEPLHLLHLALRGRIWRVACSAVGADCPIRLIGRDHHGRGDSCSNLRSASSAVCLTSDQRHLEFPAHCLIVLVTETGPLPHRNVTHASRQRGDTLHPDIDALERAGSAQTPRTIKPGGQREDRSRIP